MKKESQIIAERISKVGEYAQQSLGFVEAKNGAFLAFCSAILAASLTVNQTDGCLMRALAVSVFLLAICIWILVMSFFPVNGQKDNAESAAEELDLFSSENIARMGLDQLTSIVLAGTEVDELDEFDIQRLKSVMRDTQAASRKYKLFRLATRIFVLYLIALAAYVVILFLN